MEQRKDYDLENTVEVLWNSENAIWSLLKTGYGDLLLKRKGREIVRYTYDSEKSSFKFNVTKTSIPEYVTKVVLEFLESEKNFRVNLNNRVTESTKIAIAMKKEANEQKLIKNRILKEMECLVKPEHREQVREFIKLIDKKGEYNPDALEVLQNATEDVKREMVHLSIIHSMNLSDVQLEIYKTIWNIKESEEIKVIDSKFINMEKIREDAKRADEERIRMVNKKQGISKIENTEEENPFDSPVFEGIYKSAKPTGIKIAWGYSKSDLILVMYRNRNSYSVYTGDDRFIGTYRKYGEARKVFDRKLKEYRTWANKGRE